MRREATRPLRGIGGDIRPRRRPVVAAGAPARPLVIVGTELRGRVAPPARVGLVRRWMGEAAQYAATAAAALGAAYSPTIGQWLVLVYAVAAVVRQRSSSLSFGLALCLLAMVPFFQVIGQTGIAQNAALYAFEILVIGTVQAIWEQAKIHKTSN